MRKERRDLYHPWSQLTITIEVQWLLPTKGQKGAGPDSLNASHFRDYFIPLRGAFHLPLTVLSAIDLAHLFSLGWKIHRDSGRIFTCPTVLRNTSSASSVFRRRGLTLFGRPFQGRLPIQKSSHVEVLLEPRPRAAGRTLLFNS